MDWATWWESQAWGTVPDWFAAVGATGALVVAGVVLFRDISARRRRDADQFSITARWSSSEWPEGDPPYVTLLGRNSGSRPIVHARVDVLEDGVELHGVVMFGGLSFQHIEAGEPVSWEGAVVIEPYQGDLYLTFIDSDGQTWHRSLSTYRYVSERRWNRLTKGVEQRHMTYEVGYGQE